MKRRNFCKSLIGAAATVALPASALRDILIHRGNPMTHDGTSFAVHFGKTSKFHLYEYQREALRQLNLYEHASRVALNATRQLGKTYFIDMNYGDVEKRVLALLNTKQKLA